VQDERGVLYQILLGSREFLNSRPLYYVCSLSYWPHTLKSADPNAPLANLLTITINYPAFYLHYIPQLLSNTLSPSKYDQPLSLSQKQPLHAVGTFKFLNTLVPFLPTQNSLLFINHHGIGLSSGCQGCKQWLRLLCLVPLVRLI